MTSPPFFSRNRFYPEIDTPRIPYTVSPEIYLAGAPRAALQQDAPELARRARVSTLTMRPTPQKNA
jgi:hypothetical protein